MNFSLKSCVFEKNFVRQKDEMCEQGNELSFCNICLLRSFRFNT